MPDSIPCASACQEVFSQPSSMPRQSSRRKPSRNLVAPSTASPRTPSLASQPDPSARALRERVDHLHDAGGLLFLALEHL